MESLAPSGGRWQISTNGGDEPRWRRDGKELFFISNDNLMSVDIEHKGNAISAGTPHMLFRVPKPVGHRNSYVASADGQRFLIVTPEQPLPSSPNVVLNWPALLNELQ